MSAIAQTMTGVLPEEEAPMFVINLCASTTPVALVQPNSPELKRFTFFVTRRREEGRERFRLHMGYFNSQAEADALLADVRDVYPAAWAGPAPSHNRPAPRAVAAVPEPVVAPAVAAAPAAPGAPLELSLVDDPPRQPMPETVNKHPLEDMSNVREVLAQLDEKPAAPVTELTPAQELALLEAGAKLPDLAETAIRMMTPEDTQTLRDINLDTQNKAPPCFAVQLVWSVTPIDMTKLAQLAIFDAYTLYHVEGNRQGRRWYGVRLGFFSDAHAAKQVAYYMKADYSSVVVVPVTVKERERANGDEPRIPSLKPIAAKSPAATRSPGIEGFELLVDGGAATAAAQAGAKVNSPQTAPVSTVKPRTGKKPTGKRVVARAPTRRAEPGRPALVEETLELLGAGTLTLDEDKAQIDDSALRLLSQKPKQKSGLRFSRLLGRLSEKLGESR